MSANVLDVCDDGSMIVQSLKWIERACGVNVLSTNPGTVFGFILEVFQILKYSPQNVVK